MIAQFLKNRINQDRMLGILPKKSDKKAENAEEIAAIDDAEASELEANDSFESSKDSDSSDENSDTESEDETSEDERTSKGKKATRKGARKPSGSKKSKRSSTTSILSDCTFVVGTKFDKVPQKNTKSISTGKGRQLDVAPLRKENTGSAPKPKVSICVL